MFLRAMTLLATLAVGGYLAASHADEYNVNLAGPDTYWGAVLSNDRLPYVVGKGIVSRGPYFIDTNHREGALLVGPLVVWVNGHKPANEPAIAIGPVDLRGTTVKIKASIDHRQWMGEANPFLGGRLVFWFQSRLKNKAVAGGDYEMPPRIANYFYNRDILPEAQSGASVELPVRPDLNQWTCIGHNPVDTRPMIGSAAKYTCALNQAEFAAAMATPINMGVLLLLPVHAPDGKSLPWLSAGAPDRTPTMGHSAFTLSEFIIAKTIETVSASP